jgi:hypothetical protein
MFKSYAQDQRRPIIVLTTAVAAAVALGVSACSEGDGPTQPQVAPERISAVTQHCCAVGDSSYLIIENFAGTVTIRTASTDTFGITATKWAAHEEDLEQIELHVTERPRSLSIRTANELGLAGASVDLEIKAPMTLRVEVENGAGDIRYVGVPAGYHQFATGAGRIDVRIPFASNVGVYLRTGTGVIDVEFPMQGLLNTQTFVNGVIGTGADATIAATTGAGDIALKVMR